MSCTFCDLIQGAAEVSVCYEDAEALAFMDIQPVNAGHVLVVPRKHYESMLDVPPDVGAHLFSVTMRLANAVRRVTRCEGMNLVVNDGVAAGQDVFHYHVHIIPRRQGDGFGIELPFSGSEMPDRTVLDMTAARILAAFQDPMRGGGAGGGGAERMDAAAAQGVSQAEDVQAAMRADRAPATESWRERDREWVAQIPVHREAVSARSARGEGESLARGAVRAAEGAHGELVRDADGTL